MLKIITQLNTGLNSRLNNLNKIIGNSNKGFTMGMSIIVLGIALTLSAAMAVMLLKDVARSNTAIVSAKAYYLADSALACVNSYERYLLDVNGDGPFPTSTPDFPNFNNYTDIVSGDIYDGEYIKCLGVKIFDVSNTAITAISNLGIAPINYLNGIKTEITLEGNSLLDEAGNACVILDVYASSSQDKMIVSTARIPCTGNKVIERTIVRTIK